jgi:hypothetical protein
MEDDCTSVEMRDVHGRVRCVVVGAKVIAGESTCRVLGRAWMRGSDLRLPQDDTILLLLLQF